VQEQFITVQRLLLNLTLYFALLFGSVFVVGAVEPELLSFMPIGGTDAIEVAGIEARENSPTDLAEQLKPARDGIKKPAPTPRQIGLVALFLASASVALFSSCFRSHGPILRPRERLGTAGISREP